MGNVRPCEEDDDFETGRTKTQKGEITTLSLREKLATVFLESRFSELKTPPTEDGDCV